jgi:hypothetical protein
MRDCSLLISFKAEASEIFKHYKKGEVIPVTGRGGP